MKYSLAFHLLILTGAFGCAFTARPAAALGQEPGAAQARVAGRAKVAISNKTGQITVMGWDGDTVEASASRDGEDLPVLIKTDSPDGLTVSPDLRRGGGDIVLEVRVPRGVQSAAVSTASAVVEVNNLAGSVSVDTASGDVHVSGVAALDVRSASGNVTCENVAGAVRISTGSGNLGVNGAGSVEVKTQSGDVSLSGVRGAVEVQAQSSNIEVTDVSGSFVAQSMSGDVQAASIGGHAQVNVVSGNLVLRNVGADVRAFALSGDVTIDCVKGRVDASNASGSITLTRVGGDVEAETASGDVSFTGRVRPGGHYRMKTTSGNVRMGIQPDAPGFTATLSAYTGEVETEFPLKVEFTTTTGQINKRLVGSFGDGGVQITLNSFDGTVSLVKTAPGAEKGCK
jgi:DUF4097 and DUF4098 domain-containing protein YvlB